MSTGQVIPDESPLEARKGEADVNPDLQVNEPNEPTLTDDAIKEIEPTRSKLQKLSNAKLASMATFDTTGMKKAEIIDRIMGDTPEPDAQGGQRVVTKTTAESIHAEEAAYMDDWSSRYDAESDADKRRELVEEMRERKGELRRRFESI